MRKLILLVAATASIALAMGTATSASAATTGDTTTTFALSGGVLAITAPGTVNFGTGAAAGTLGGPLGAVTVTDDRAALGAAWTASVSSTDFTNSTVPTAAPVGKGRVTYWSGTATTSSGTAVTAPGQALEANAVTLASSRTAYSASVTTGNNSTTWDPTLTVSVPAQAIAGAYTGVVTHSLV